MMQDLEQICWLQVRCKVSRQHWSNCFFHAVNYFLKSNYERIDVCSTSSRLSYSVDENCFQFYRLTEYCGFPANFREAQKDYFTELTCILSKIVTNWQKMLFAWVWTNSFYKLWELYHTNFFFERKSNVLHIFILPFLTRFVKARTKCTKYSPIIFVLIWIQLPL